MEITYIDGRKATAEILPIDRIMFERHFGVAIRKAAAEDREEHWLWLAWQSLQRTGLADPDFDKWLTSVQDYGVGAEPEVPSDPVASTGS